ncbi:MAG TPA: alpha/beta hydrolase [Solirubrobacterales bacterium]|nr:alpha/beta hydrolase [Solirubrobacterales bacterium]
MATYRNRFGPHNPDETYVPHDFLEQLADLGEVRMNYATVGDPSRPALLLVPGQTESWWGYEHALPMLAEHFQAFAVDLRGQGRSTRTPGRYTLDNMGNDLVRFIDIVIGRPTFVSGLSSGAVLAAWLSAYAKPGLVIAAHYEDPPLWASETEPATGQGLRQGVGASFRLWSTFLGDQWSVGDWDGLRAAAPDILPAWMQSLFTPPEEPPQNLKEYDPEWARAFWTGTVAAACDHERMLEAVKVPVLFTHHFRRIDEDSGVLMGALSDVQARRALDLLADAGVPVDYRSFDRMGHSMHGQDPRLFTDTLVDWATKIVG